MASGYFLESLPRYKEFDHSDTRQMVRLPGSRRDRLPSNMNVVVMLSATGRLGAERSVVEQASASNGAVTSW